MSQNPNFSRVAIGFAFAILSSSATVFCLAAVWYVGLNTIDNMPIEPIPSLLFGMTVSVFGLAIGFPIALIVTMPVYMLFLNRIGNKRVFSIVVGVLMGLTTAAIGISIVFTPSTVASIEFLDMTAPFYLMGASGGAIGGLVFFSVVFADKLATSAKRS